MFKGYSLKNPEKWQHLTPEEQEIAWGNYKKFRSYHFTDAEATEYVTAVSVRKDGTFSLQNQDFNAPVWQQVIKERRNKYIAKCSYYLSDKRVNKKYASTLTMRSFEKDYNEHPEKRPFDLVEKVSPTKLKRRNEDYDSVAANWDTRYVQASGWGVM